MIMRSGQQLLLPANPLFIWASLIAALLLNMLPLGRAPWMPDFMAVVLVFWNVHQPLRVGIGLAFMFGLGMDVHQSSLLGQHALSYTALSFFATMIHRRLLWFSGRRSPEASLLAPVQTCSSRFRAADASPEGAIFSRGGPSKND